MKYYVDLKRYLNFRISYPKETPKDEIEDYAANNYLLQEDFKKGGIIGNSTAEIYYKKAGNFDCIECGGLVINIPDILCSGITIAGSCAWGAFREKFKIIFSDGSYAFADVAFWEIASTPEEFIKYLFEAEAKDLQYSVLKEYGQGNERAYIYYNTTVFPETKKIRRIIFPDNICMFIFGITLEN